MIAPLTLADGLAQTPHVPAGIAATAGKVVHVEVVRRRSILRHVLVRDCKKNFDAKFLEIGSPRRRDLIVTPPRCRGLLDALCEEAADVLNAVGTDARAEADRQREAAAAMGKPSRARHRDKTENGGETHEASFWQNITVVCRAIRLFCLAIHSNFVISVAGCQLAQEDLLGFSRERNSPKIFDDSYVADDLRQRA
ncbi:hypothetical protein ACXIT0_23470 [Methylorubrum extorquens]